MADTLKIIVLEGDETGQELLEQAIRVLDADVVGFEIELEHFDLSLTTAARPRTRWCTTPRARWSRPASA